MSRGGTGARQSGNPAVRARDGGFGSPDARAVKIAERCYDTWFGHVGSGRDEAALSVLAAFMLADKVLPDVVLKSTDAEVVKGMTDVFTAFWCRRPDLGCWVGPLADWMQDERPDKDLVRAAAATARTAVKAGICDLLDVDHLLDVDLLGHAYTTMRPRSARGARGEFYTPAHVCYLMAKMIIGGPDGIVPGMSIAEPAAGTGGMLRAAAQVVREAGHDPGELVWVANDITPVPVACLAVNCYSWRMGHNVVLGVADTLGEPDWYLGAWKRICAAIEHRDDIARTAAFIIAARRAERLIAGAAEDCGPRPGLEAELGDAAEVPKPAEPDGAWDKILPSDGTLFDPADLGEPAEPRPRHRGRGTPRRGAGPPPAPSGTLLD